VPQAKIETTGQLREFLTNMMLGVKNGNIDRSDAETLVKLAAQVNESFYSEIKVARVRHDLAAERPGGQGHLLIGETEPPK
jgi:hypothetical protein